MLFGIFWGKLYILLHTLFFASNVVPDGQQKQLEPDWLMEEQVKSLDPPSVHRLETKAQTPSLNFVLHKS